MLCEICRIQEAAIEAKLDKELKIYCRQCFQRERDYFLKKSQGKVNTTKCNNCNRFGNVVLKLKLGFNSNKLGMYCPDCLEIASPVADFEYQEVKNGTKHNKKRN